MKKLRKLPLVLFCCFFFFLSCEKENQTQLPLVKVPGITDTRILIGSSLALGGHASYLGTQTLHGAMAYLTHVNKEGGIYGRKIKVIAYDDGYDPPRCVANT